jgi:hypothetical protein
VVAKLFVRRQLAAATLLHRNVPGKNEKNYALNCVAGLASRKEFPH